jgi:hypothetical protein
MEFPPPPPREPGKSSGCLKYGLIGCGALILLFILISVGTGYYLSRHGGSLMAAGDSAMRAGIETARRSDEKGCVDAAEARMKKGGAFEAGVSGSIFLEACLRSSQPALGFCDSVPPATEFTRSAAWQQSRCGKAALSPGESMRCTSVSGAIQRYCTVDGREKVDPDSALAHLHLLDVKRRERVRVRER